MSKPWHESLSSYADGLHFAGLLEQESLVRAALHAALAESHRATIAHANTADALRAALARAETAEARVAALEYAVDVLL